MKCRTCTSVQSRVGHTIRSDSAGVFAAPNQVVGLYSPSTRRGCDQNPTRGGQRRNSTKRQFALATWFCKGSSADFKQIGGSIPRVGVWRKLSTDSVLFNRTSAHGSRGWSRLCPERLRFDHRSRRRCFPSPAMRPYALHRDFPLHPSS
jgi:hypothetical protein